jgi:glycosyltransferase involved in cell wall biosynthesis
MVDLVSILIPAYNAGKWIGETIKSALNQTWPRTEIILVDDGSTDETLKIVRSFVVPRLRVVCQNNAGPCVARNTAFCLAQGDFIQWLDADDVLAPDKIEQQMLQAAGGPGSGILFAASFGTFRFGLHNARFQPTSVWQDLSPRDFLVRKFTDNAHIVLHSWLISRTIAESAGPWDVRLQRTDADGEYVCRLVRACERVVFVPESKCYYRKGIVGSLSATRTHIEEEALLLDLLFKHLLALEDSAATRNACMSWLQLWARGYYMSNRETLHVFSQLAAALGYSGAKLSPPIKFMLAETVLGWNGARAARQLLSGARFALANMRERLFGDTVL